MEALASPGPLGHDCLIAPTPAPASCWRHALIRVTTRRATDFVDITDRMILGEAADRTRGLKAVTRDDSGRD
jgi:hypothetical protein